MPSQKYMRKIRSHHVKTKVTGNFYQSIRFVLVILKVMGVLPLSNVIHSTGENIRFSWISPYTLLIFMPGLLLQIFFILIQFYGLGKGLTENNTLIILFYFVCLVESSLVLNFCRKWQKLIADIESIEKLLPPMRRPRAAMRFLKSFGFFYVCFGIGYIFSYICFKVDRVVKCYRLPDDSGFYLRSYFMFTMAWFYEIFPFSYTFSFIIQVIKIQAIITWFLIDVLIINICIYLINRFKNFNRLIILKEYTFTKSFRPSWSELQVHYTRICRLVLIVDNHINAMVFVSYLFNLYHICQQVYKFLNELTGTNTSDLYDCVKEQDKDGFTTIYKTYKIIFVVLRTAMISHLASKLHILSRKPLGILHTVPASEYDCDMKRLMDQVYHSKVGISGLRFFQITQSMVLRIFTQLMTYELVLVQFATADRKQYQINKRLTYDHALN